MNWLEIVVITGVTILGSLSVLRPGWAAVWIGMNHSELSNAKAKARGWQVLAALALYLAIKWCGYLLFSVPPANWR